MKQLIIEFNDRRTRPRWLQTHKNREGVETYWTACELRETDWKEGETVMPHSYLEWTQSKWGVWRKTGKSWNRWQPINPRYQVVEKVFY